MTGYEIDQIPLRVCVECGAPLENTAAGNYALCPNYHGKLQPKLSDYELLMLGASKMPVAQQTGNGKCEIDGAIWKIAGDIGIKTACARAHKGEVVARCAGAKRGFVVCEPL